MLLISFSGPSRVNAELESRRERLTYKAINDCFNSDGLVGVLLKLELHHAADSLDALDFGAG